MRARGNVVWACCLYLLLCGVCIAEPEIILDADSVAKDENYLVHAPSQLLGVTAKDVYTGGYQSAYISDKDELFLWGLIAGKVTPTPTKAFSSYTNTSIVSIGGYHGLSLDSQGRLYSWGRGTHGALGHGGQDDIGSPTQIETLAKRKVKLIAAGYAHSVAVTDAGVYTWGLGSRGQLGTGGTKDISTPKLLKVKGVPLKRIVDVCAGGHYTALLTDDGEIYTFGANNYGTLGHGNTKDILTPTKVNDLERVVKISCGGDHMLALSTEKRVYSWGWGEMGQLGANSTEDVLLPQEVRFVLTDGEFPESLSAGGYATSFVSTNLGRLFAFGWGEYGMLGNKAQDNVLIPTGILDSFLVKKVDGGGYKHTIILTQSHEVFVFGENTFGQLGLSEPPTHIHEDNNYFQVMP